VLIISNDEKSLRKIAKRVYNWYEKWLEENVEAETRVMETIDLNKPEGRFELFILARLFNNPLREETAIKYFKRLKEFFFSKGFVYSFREKMVGKIDVHVVKDRGHRLHRELKDTIVNTFVQMNQEIRRKNYRGFVRCAEVFLEKDMIEYVNETSNAKDLLDVICERTRPAGIFVKTFWIIREMYKAGVWKIDRTNLWMCCVPDSKVRKYLNKMGFVHPSVRIDRGQMQYSLSQLKEYSKIIWKYFNEQFGKPYFDLSIFRYLKETHELSPEEFERL